MEKSKSKSMKLVNTRKSIRQCFKPSLHLDIVGNHILRGRELLRIREEFYEFGYKVYPTIKKYFNEKRPLGVGHAHASNLIRMAINPMETIAIAQRLNTTSISKIAKLLPKLEN